MERMTAKQLKRLGSDEQVRKRLAKFMVQECFRNSELENLHAGKAPSSITGDYAYVKVVSPFGEIPWPELSRLNNEEMKTLMIDVLNKTYKFLSVLFDASPSRIDTILNGLEKADLVPQWNDPKPL